MGATGREETSKYYLDHADLWPTQDRLQLKSTGFGDSWRVLDDPVTTPPTRGFASTSVGLLRIVTMGCGASKTGESACLVRQEPTVQPVGRMQPVAALPAEDVAAAVAAGRWKLERAANAVFRTLCGEHNLTVSRCQLAAKLKADGELEALLCNKDVANGDDMAKTMRLLMLEDEDGLHHDP